jgi:anti-sigma factor RsiW
MKRDSPHDCPRVEALSLLVDDEISGSARDEIEAHAAYCPLCGAMLRKFRDLRDALGGLEAPAPGVDIATLIDARLAPRTQSRRARRRAGWRWQFAPAGLAAAGVLAMGAYLGMLLAGGTTVNTGRAPAVAVFSSVPPGGLCLMPACYPRGK